MNIGVSLTSLTNGAYVGAIQDALGNSGARVALTTGAQGSVEISGTPTGEGLKIRAKELQAGLAARGAGSDAISLSPEAQAALNRQQIALALIVQGSDKPEHKGEDQKPPEAVSAVQQAGGASDTIDATDVTALAQQDPTQLVKDLVGAAETAVAQISTTEGFQTAAAANPSFLQSTANSFPDGLGGDFLKAVANGTLVVQSGADAGWDVGGGLLLTGLSENFVGGSNNSKFDTSATNVVCTDFGFGQVVFSWPKGQQSNGSLPVA